MPDAASVNLKVGLSTGEASKAVESLRGQLASLGKDVSGVRGSLAGRWDAMALGRRVSVAGGLATGAADLFSSLAGEDSRTGMLLKKTTASMKQFGTMLAPLGPWGVGAGVALGGVVGALKSLSDESAEAAKRMNEAAQSLRDSSAKTAISESRARTPEEKARLQAAAHERMSDYRIKLERGATISDDEILDAARWNRGLAKKLMERSRDQNGGRLSDRILPLQDLYTMGEDRLRGYAADENQSSASRTQWRRQFEAVQALGPEILATARLKSGKAFDKGLDSLYAEMMAPKGAKTTDLSEKLAPGRTAHERGAQADSWSAQGIGYTGNPMQMTETLLREIGARLAEMRDIARRTARTPLPAVAI